MSLSKEASNKDEQLQMQMLVSFDDDNSKIAKMCGWKVGFLMIVEVI